MREKRFFTMVELLIVISVIVILISMLLPALSKAREQGRRSSCANNVKQIGLGIQMYAQDYNGWAPAGSNVSNYLYNKNEAGGMADYINVNRPFLSNNDAPPIARCPSGGRDGTKKLQAADTNPNFSYSMNQFFSWPEVPQYFERLDRVKNPSKRLLLGEIGVDGCYTFTVDPNCKARCLTRRSYFAFRHFKKTNICYADNHLGILGFYNIPETSSSSIDKEDFFSTH